MSKKQKIKELEDQLKNRDKYIRLASKDYVATLKKYKDFIKDLEHKLVLAGELSGAKDVKLNRLFIELLAAKISSSMLEAARVAKELEDGVVEAPTNFSSRFMPNVKFKVDGHSEKLAEIGIYTSGKGYIEIRHDGEMSMIVSSGAKIVSIYEAIPELVPDGMVYDKKSDSLIEEAFSTMFNRSEDKEAFEAMLSKMGHRKDDVFKVTEVISVCDSCKIKPTCSLLRQLKCEPTIIECADYQELENIPSESFIIFADHEGQEYGVLKEIWEEMLLKGSVLKGKMP